MGRLKELEGLYPFNVAALRRSILNNKVTGAYLFEGFGDAVSDVAVRFVQALLCEKKLGDACGECKSCRLVESGVHPSVHRVDLSERALSMADVREIEDFVLLPPVGGRHRVVFIDRLKKYSLEAINALLKTVEEPSRDVVFVMVVPYRHLLPKTFVSRCQVFYFPSVREFGGTIAEYGDRLIHGRLSVDEVVDISTKWDRKRVSELLNYIARKLLGEGRSEDAARLLDMLRDFDTYNLSSSLIVDSVILGSIGGVGKR